jgi:hypothetical protein
MDELKMQTVGCTNILRIERVREFELPKGIVVDIATAMPMPIRIISNETTFEGDAFGRIIGPFKGGKCIVDSETTVYMRIGDDSYKNYVIGPHGPNSINVQESTVEELIASQDPLFFRPSRRMLRRGGEGLFFVIEVVAAKADPQWNIIYMRDMTAGMKKYFVRANVSYDNMQFSYRLC